MFLIKIAIHAKEKLYLCHDFVGSEENVNLPREILIKRKVCMVYLLSISLKEALLNLQKLINKKKRGELFKKRKET